MNEDLYVILLILGLPIIITTIECLLSTKDDKPYYKERFTRINRNERDTILDRNDK
tara:strand:- start:297 stop:464 length:168 start_codon:yes stop_codon:yes gene_type:complete